MKLDCQDLSEMVLTRCRLLMLSFYSVYVNNVKVSFVWEVSSSIRNSTVMLHYTTKRTIATTCSLRWRWRCQRQQGRGMKFAPTSC